MEPETTKPPEPKAMFWASIVASALALLMLVPSGIMKLVKPSFLLEGFAKYGYPESVISPLGVIELTCTIIYVIPQTSILGAILLTGYLGGAVSTHVRAGEPFIGALGCGVLVWLGLFLRNSRLRALILGRS
jgi:hypothetical protein